MAFEALDWFPDRDRDEPDPTHFDEHHVAFIEFQDRDVEVTGYWIHADPSDGAPSAWQIESALFVDTYDDASEDLFQDAAAMRRAENALSVARAGWPS